MSLITANGVRLAYDEAGTGPTVVWVHGSWTDRRGANLFLVPLLAEHYRVITYDRRGHSQSERPPCHQRVGDHVADLAALIEQLDAAPAHLVTNSFGGEIALKLAVQQPDLVASLCLHEPCLFGLLPDDPGVKQALADFQASTALVAAELEKGRPETAVPLFMDTVVGSGAWDAFPEQTRRTFVHNAPTWLDEERDPTQGTIDIGQLANVAVPVLLTQGGRSAPLFSADLGRLAEAVPRASVHVRGCGSRPALDAPGRVRSGRHGLPRQRRGQGFVRDPWVQFAPGWERFVHLRADLRPTWMRPHPQLSSAATEEPQRPSATPQARVATPPRSRSITFEATPAKAEASPARMAVALCIDQ